MMLINYMRQTAATLPPMPMQKENDSSRHGKKDTTTTYQAVRSELIGATSSLPYDTRRTE
jgi:hypothetical protein